MLKSFRLKAFLDWSSKFAKEKTEKDMLYLPIVEALVFSEEEKRTAW
jgi:hypothetical protein